jgi:multidrug efflux pump subunit AcrB
VRGVSGILFKEMAYVIIFALVCSLTVSLSLVPMLASRFLTTTSTIAQATATSIEPLDPRPGLRFQGSKPPTWIVARVWITASSPSCGGCPARGQPAAPAPDRQ